MRRRVVYHGRARGARGFSARSGAARLPVVVAAVLFAAAALRLYVAGGINDTSPGGRYVDPLAPTDREGAGPGIGLPRAPELSADGLEEWYPASGAGWSYRAVLSRLAAAEGSRRVSIRLLGEARYGGEAYPLVAATVSAASAAPARIRVLLTAGVHGNEPAGVEALVRFVELLSRSPGLYREVAFDVIPVVNPWGWSRDLRSNGAGKDINRDLASSNTQEAALVRRFVAARTRENGRYTLAIDHHESAKGGYFAYQYTRRGLASAFVQTVELAGKPLERDYREGGFRVRNGVLSMPAIILPYVSMLRRLSLEQLVRLSGTRNAYTLESPLGDSYADRVRIHGEAVRAMVNACLRSAGAPVDSRITPVSRAATGRPGS